MATRPTTMLLLLGWLLTAAPAGAQTAEIIYSRQPRFKIPFKTESGEQRIQKVQLHVSEDQGQTWQLWAGVAPSDQRHFDFQAPRDGLYYFTVRTIDVEGRAHPATLDQNAAGLKVAVDTLPPAVVLRAGPGNDNAVSVDWEITDENLDLTTLVLEYRVANGGAEWRPLTAERQPVGRRAWSPATNAPLDVRLRVSDRAGNAGDGVAVVAQGTGGAPRSMAPAREAGGSRAHSAPAAGGSMRIINSKTIRLNYEVKDVGKSGVAMVELWSTREGRAWQKLNERPNHQSPYEAEMEGEGVYGFTMVARSGVGLGEQPPRAGDPPQVWVEIDLTRPVTRLLSVDVGRGIDTGNLTIMWTATDKNLERQPITLSYAEGSEGPWTPIATGLENSGRYTWRMPPGVPFRFLVRVEAIDRAGNVGTSQTDAEKPVIVDLSQPKVQVLGVEAVGKP